jgi:hypothetical protein
MLEQKQAINRVLAEDRKTNVNISWQDEDVLLAMDEALKPDRHSLRGELCDRIVSTPCAAFGHTGNVSPFC